MGAVEPEAAVAVPLHLRLLDDRGQPITEPLEVCRVHGLETECSEWAAEDDATVAGGFDSLLVEGPLHGPVRVRRRELQEDDEGRFVLEVPRKVELRLRGLPKDAVTLSLYDVESPQFRFPTWRRLGQGVEWSSRGLLIPSGRFVLSIAAPGQAPDLQLVEAPPGGRLKIPYRQRPGWSLLLRIVAAVTGAPAVGARIRLEAMPGWGDPARDAWNVETDKFGLAVVSGISAPLLQAEVEHPDFVLETAPGFSSSPGSFGFEQIELAPGGAVRARVTRDGEPLPGAACRLWKPFRPTRAGEVDHRPPLFSAITGQEGFCGGQRLAAGEYYLEIRPSEGFHQARWVERVQVISGEESQIEVALRPIRVEGQVLRGSEPVPGYRVRVQRRGAPRQPPQPELIEVETGEDGRYEAVIWEAGAHLVILRDARGASAGTELVDLEPPSEAVDFLLAPEDIVGVVVDRDGKPIGEATVRLRWPLERGVSHRLSSTGEGGEFSFSVDDRSGSAEIRASKEGYTEAAATLEVVKGTPPPPVRLELRRRPGLSGTVLAAPGTPLMGGWVGVYSLASDGAVVPLGSARTDAAGHFQVPGAKAGPSRLFVTGAGCPLTMADTGAENEPIEILCPPSPAALRLTLRRSDGLFGSGVPIYVRQGEVLIPREVVRIHQTMLGLSATTDGSGRLTLVGLAPGDYDLYLADATDPLAIRLGYPNGHLVTVSLAALEAAEVEVTIQTSPP